MNLLNYLLFWFNWTYCLIDENNIFRSIIRPDSYSMIKISSSLQHVLKISVHYETAYTFISYIRHCTHTHGKLSPLISVHLDDTKADLSSISRHIFNRAIKYIKMGGPIHFYRLSHVLDVFIERNLYKKLNVLFRTQTGHDNLQVKLK